MTKQTDWIARIAPAAKAVLVQIAISCELIIFKVTNKIFVMTFIMAIIFNNFAFANSDILKIKIQETSFEVNKYNRESGRWVSFYIKEGNINNIVVIFKKNNEKYGIFIKNKIDCELSNYLIKNNYLYIATLNQSNDGLANNYFIEKYKLEINNDQEPGVSLYSFIYLSKKETRKIYCDGITPIEKEALQ